MRFELKEMNEKYGGIVKKKSKTGNHDVGSWPDKNNNDNNIEKKRRACTYARAHINDFSIRRVVIAIVTRRLRRARLSVTFFFFFLF